MFMLMILYDFCLLPAQFYGTVIYIWKIEAWMQIVDLCAGWCREFFVGAAILGGPNSLFEVRIRATL
jgi:hypothetical protein